MSITMTPVYVLVTSHEDNRLEPEVSVYSNQEQMDNAELSFLRQVYHQFYSVMDSEHNEVETDQAPLELLRWVFNSDSELGQVPGGWSYVIKGTFVDWPLIDY